MAESERSQKKAISFVGFVVVLFGLLGVIVFFFGCGFVWFVGCDCFFWFGWVCLWFCCGFVRGFVCLVCFELLAASSFHLRPAVGPQGLSWDMGSFGLGVKTPNLGVPQVAGSISPLIRPGFLGYRVFLSSQIASKKGLSWGGFRLGSQEVLGPFGFWSKQFLAFLRAFWGFFRLFCFFFLGFSRESNK